MDEAERCNVLGLMNAGNLVALGTPEELKENLAADFYAASASSVLKAYNELLSLDFVNQVALFGNKIHILTNKREKELTKDYFQEAGASIEEIVKIRPSLEDVFIYHMMQD